nr:MAG TPA: pentapeptide repeat protein [Bacteriophage sp.]
MTKERLADILAKHKLWLEDSPKGEKADLSGANLRGADLIGANLRGADLIGADLSGADGLLSAVNFMKAHFERTPEGYIAYKMFSCEYTAPKSWKIEPGSVITENVNFNRTNECGCGINVAPLEWVRRNYGHKKLDIWKVLIRWEWLCGVCAEQGYAAMACAVVPGVRFCDGEAEE